MSHSTIRLISRPVSDFGEILVVRESNGYKALVDPCDENVFVQVPAGRRANLVRYQFDGLTGRDAHVEVVKTSAGLGFASAYCPSMVPLQVLGDGQLVDVMPTAEPAVVYAAIHHPLPVLHGAVATELVAA